METEELIEELGKYYEQLKSELKLPNIPLVWIPKDEEYPKEGEIVEGVVYVYNRDIKDAKHTLLHEFVELLVLSVNQADKIAATKKEAYHMREAVVETLCSVIIKNECVSNNGKYSQE